MKKTKSNPQMFTTHTLWTAPSQKQDHTDYKFEITPEINERCKKAVEESRGSLEEKLKSFEPVPLSDAAIRYVVK
jgi:hypothetical protein